MQIEYIGNSVVPFGVLCAGPTRADDEMPIVKWCAALPLLMLGSAIANAESGLASFYPGVGKKDEMTCAHRSHPFGKKLRVSHGKISIECLVNDRGPFIRGRIIDVSTSAARALGMIDAGVVQVMVEAVEEEKGVIKDANNVVKDTNHHAAQEIAVAENSL